MHNGYSYALFLRHVNPQYAQMCVHKIIRQITCVYLSINYFYTSKLQAQFTLLNYAHIAGVIFTENYVKKMIFTRQNYGVEFCSIIMSKPM
jgi:hypothetical protein